MLMQLLKAIGGEPLFDRFRRTTCFGHLANLDLENKYIRAHHHVAARLLRMEADDENLWFHLRGMPVSFPPQEFALITGLNFGASSFDPTVRYSMTGLRTYNAFCASMGRKKVSDLVRRVLDIDNLVQGGDRSELYFRAVLVCVAHTLVFGSDRVMDKWVWVLVEDLDAFNAFPWGAYSYKLLLHHMRTGGGAMGMRWHLYGPQWALSMWAFERILGLGYYVADEIQGNPAPYPRCLRWQFREKPREEIDWQLFFEDPHLRILEMHPDGYEMQTRYWLSANGPASLAVLFTGPDNKLARGEQPDTRRGPAHRPPVAPVAPVPRRRRGAASATAGRQSSRRATVVELDDDDDEVELQDIPVQENEIPRSQWHDLPLGLHDIPVGMHDIPVSRDQTRRRSTSDAASRPGRASYESSQDRGTPVDAEYVAQTVRHSQAQLRDDIRRDIQQSEGRMMSKMKSVLGKMFKKGSSSRATSRSDEQDEDDSHDDRSASSAQKGKQVAGRHSVHSRRETQVY